MHPMALHDVQAPCFRACITMMCLANSRDPPWLPSCYVYATLQVHVAASGGNATHVNASSNVIGVLKALGNYGIFLQALQVGLTMLLPASLVSFCCICGAMPHTSMPPANTTAEAVASPRLLDLGYTSHLRPLQRTCVVPSR